MVVSFFANIVHFILIGTNKTDKKFSDERKKSVGDAVLVIGKIPTRIGKQPCKVRNVVVTLQHQKQKQVLKGIAKQQIITNH